MDPVQLIQAVGVPVGMLLIVMWAMWQAAKWVARKGEPIIDAHIVLMDSLRKNLEKQTETLDQIAIQQREHMEVCRAKPECPGSNHR